MSDYHWRIDDIQVDALEGSQPTVAKGEAGTYRFRLTPGDISTEGGALYGTVASGALHGSVQQGTLYGSQTSTHLERYAEILSYRHIAGAVATLQTVDRKTKYREQHTADKSLLVKLEPGADVIEGQPIWALIMGVNDESVRPQRRAIINLEVLNLAPASEYADKASLRADLEF